MPSKAIHQLPFSSTREDDDRFYVVRNDTDYQIPGSAMAPALLSQTVVIPTASVLTLNTTPVQVVDPSPAGFAIFPVRAVVQFSAGTNYGTNTQLVIGGTTTVDDSTYGLLCDISDGSAAVGMYLSANLKTVDGDSLSAYVTTGNPATGTRNLTITTFYYLIEL
jgi:hypothetical protein